MTITEFLMARIAEDEAAQDDPAEWSSDQWHRADCEVNTHTSGPCDCGLPARVLAECEAKRRIVETLVIPYIHERRRLMGGRPSWGDEHPELILWIARPYADHPDYREEWRVS